MAIVDDERRDEVEPALPDENAPKPTWRIVRAARAGQPGSWDELVQRYGGAIAATVERRIPRDLRGRIDAEGVAQSGLVRAYRNLASFDYKGKGSFWRWLKTIVANLTSTRVRDQRAAKRAAVQGELAFEADELPARLVDPSPSRKALQNERSRLLAAAVDALGEDDAQLLRRHFYDGVPLHEIAAERGVTVKALRNRMSRLFGLLAKRLGP